MNYFNSLVFELPHWGLNRLEVEQPVEPPVEPWAQIQPPVKPVEPVDHEVRAENHVSLRLQLLEPKIRFQLKNWLEIRVEVIGRGVKIAVLPAVYLF